MQIDKELWCRFPIVRNAEQVARHSTDENYKEKEDRENADPFGSHGEAEGGLDCSDS